MIHSKVGRYSYSASYLRRDSEKLSALDIISPPATCFLAYISNLVRVSYRFGFRLKRDMSIWSLLLNPEFHWLRQITTTLRKFHWRFWIIFLDAIAKAKKLIRKSIAKPLSHWNWQVYFFQLATKLHELEPRMEVAKLFCQWLRGDRSLFWSYRLWASIFLSPIHSLYYTNTIKLILP